MRMGNFESGSKRVKEIRNHLIREGYDIDFSTAEEMLEALQEDDVSLCAAFTYVCGEESLNQNKEEGLGGSYENYNIWRLR